VKLFDPRTQRLLSLRSLLVSRTATVKGEIFEKMGLSASIAPLGWDLYVKSVDGMALVNDNTKAWKHRHTFIICPKLTNSEEHRIRRHGGFTDPGDLIV